MRLPMSYVLKFDPKMTKHKPRHVARRMAMQKPVFIMKLSVGSLSLCSLSDSSDLTGRERMIAKTMHGSRIAMQTHRLGDAEQSLNKHMIVPKMTKQITAKVPFPIPSTSPS